MTPLYDAIECVTPKSRPSLIKYLKASKINSWNDIDTAHLKRFAKIVRSSMAPSSAHTTFAVFKGFLSKFDDEIDLPKGWRKILVQKNEDTMKTYLTAEEVEKFGEVWVDDARQQTVRDGFYVSCKTGLRHSDLVKLTPSNFEKREDGSYLLNYVSKKTKIHATIPCSAKTKEKVDWLHKNGKQVSLSYYNYMVRTIAEWAGINEEVSVYKAGQELTGPKYQFISSHSARVSFSTILADFDTDLVDIMRMAGHKDPAMTARYIVRHGVRVNKKVQKFLM